MKATGIIVLILVIFATAVLAEVWRELHCFKITRYRIRTSKIKGDAGKVRIAFLSDLHNHVYGKENEELLLAIREAKPDLILAGGDMLAQFKVLNDCQRFLVCLFHFCPPCLNLFQHRLPPESRADIHCLHTSSSLRQPVLKP